MQRVAGSKPANGTNLIKGKKLKELLKIMKDIVLVSLQKTKTQNVLVKFLEKKKDVFVNYISNKKMVRYTSKDGG